MSERRPVCTIQTCGNFPVTQKLYRCNTCHFADTESICEACANFCHANHDVEFLGYHIGYCWCGYGCNRCHCFLQNPVPGDMDIPDNVPRQCTFRYSLSNYVEMNQYTCEQCGIVGSQVCCQACHYLCHRGHEGSSFHANCEAYCDCGDPTTEFKCKLMPPENPPPPIPICTFLLSGEKMISQRAYRCKTCNQVGNVTICEACAKVCHAGHDLELTTYDVSYCDCGAGNESAHCVCKLMEKIEPAQ